MTEPVKRRGRGWKILGIVVGVIVLSIGTMFLWVSVVAGRKMEQMETRAKAMIADWRARSAERPVLHGTASPGNAWDEYKPALDELRTTKNISKLGMLVTRDAKADLEFGKTMLATHGKALELLRQGAGRATSRYPYDWESGMDMQMPGLLGAQSLGNLGVLQARALAESGKPREAAEVLLDVCQFGRDVGSDGVMICEMIGAAVLGLGLSEARDLTKANLLDAAALRDLDAGLAVLETTSPKHGRVLSNEAIYAGSSLRKMAAESGTAFGRLLYANGFERIVDWLTRASKVDDLAWAEVPGGMNALEEESKSSWNPMARMMMGGLSGTGKIGRQRLVQVRMLRIVSHFKATGEVLDLEDPFSGAKLKMEQVGGAFKIWSVGPDGIDDGGVGGWDQTGKDLVLDPTK